jgi:hypothetical protein
MQGVMVTFQYNDDVARERVTGLYGVPPTIDYLEIAEFVDNTGA